MHAEVGIFYSLCNMNALPPTIICLCMQGYMHTSTIGGMGSKYCRCMQAGCSQSNIHTFPAFPYYIPCMCMHANAGCPLNYSML